MNFYELKLLDVMPSAYEGKGIFSKMSDMPWEDDTETKNALDVDYISKSGFKQVSPLLRVYAQKNAALTPGEYALTDDQLSYLAKIVSLHFRANWEKLYSAMTAEYNPINNYDMKEHEEATDKDTGTVTDEGSLTHGETITGDESTEDTQNTIYGKTQKVATDDTTTESVYGFNETNPAPANQTKRTGTTDTTDGGNDTLSRNGTTQSTESHTGTDKNGNTRTNDLTHTIERDLTRAGNIGVTTSQQMIQSEIDLRRQNFFDIVFADLDSILALPIY